MMDMRTLLLALLLTGILSPAAASAAAPGPAARSRLDPGLALAALPGAEPVAVWVEFADKGERGPADLAERLAEAGRRLTPEARRRRERARVRPLVDWLDLPVEPAYVRELEARGLAPYGVSRWFNRVAVRAAGPLLEELAGLAFVRRVAPVELASPRPRVPVPPAEPPGSGAGARAARASAATLLDYGQTHTQLERLGVPAVHDSGYIGTGIGVCVLDDGFNYFRKHTALRSIVVGGGRTRDFIRGISSVQDTSTAYSAFFSHGAWILSALAGNAPGIYLGPAHGANFALGRTEDGASEKPIEMVYWAMGAEWADSLGCDLISSSLGYNLFPDSAGTDITYAMLDGHTTVITRAAEIAAAKGILVVVSAGNDGNNPAVGRKVGAPADAHGDSVLAIAAVDSFGVRASFSSKGPTVDGRIKPDLAAQGVQVLVAGADGNPNTYTRLSGTSLAAPLVSGLAACLMQARPDWPAVWIVEALKASATRAANPDTLVGWGIPDGLAALRYVPDTLGVPGPSGPLALRLAGPNPLRAGTGTLVRLSLGLGSPATRYRLRLYDAGGRMVRELASGSLAPGAQLSIPWRGDDGRGRALTPGLYFLALDGAGDTRAARIVVLR
jgi:subtilisin family serine protease